MEKNLPRVVVCILTHVPRIVVKTVKQKLLRKVNEIIILVPKHQVKELKLLLSQVPGKLPPVVVVPHVVELDKNGVPRMGILRHLQQNILQSRMEPNDIGLLLDHDIRPGTSVIIHPALLRLYNKKEKERKDFYKICGVAHLKSNHGHRNKALSSEMRKEFEERRLGVPYSRRMGPNAFVQRIRLLAEKARDGGFLFFRPASENSAHNKRAEKGTFCPVATWSGFFGLFKDTPNYYDPTMTIGSDVDVQFHAIYAHKKLVVLCDPCIVVQMTLGKRKYADGGSFHQARLSNYHTVFDRYPNVSKWIYGKSLCCGLEHLKYTKIYD